MREFRVEIPEAQLVDLRSRLAMTRWPEAATVGGWTQGVPLDYAQELCAYWADGYDWRRCEAELNAIPQFVTGLDGGGDDSLDIHFLHVRSSDVNAVPLLLTHGWPGSVIEFLDVVGPLSETFHVVAPSLPGYGFSAKPTATGWGVERIATAWAQLMDRLGYDRWFAAGGDWGSIITSALGAAAPDAGTLIVARVLQGASLGVVPLGISIMRDLLPPGRVGSGIALMSTSLGVGGAVGLVLGLLVGSVVGSLFARPIGAAVRSLRRRLNTDDEPHFEFLAQ